MNKKLNALLYLNTHFSGIEGEDLENRKTVCYKPQDIFGQRSLFEKIAGNKINIVGVIVGGDNYGATEENEAIEKVFDLIHFFCNQNSLGKPDVLFAGPCFKAGRYGIFSQALCRAVSKRFGITSIAGMHESNPGIEDYLNDIFANKENAYIVRTPASVSGTNYAITTMTNLAVKILSGGKVTAKKDGYVPRGKRINVFAEKPGYERALDMLSIKLKGEPFKTELFMPSIATVVPAKALLDLSKAKIAIGTTGGIVPIDNPDKIAGSDAKMCGVYPLEDLERLSPETHRSVHAGYDQTHANINPNWVLPVDLMRQLEKDGVIGKLHNEYFSTVGNGTDVANAEKMALQVGEKLKMAGVQAIILTST